MAVKSYNNIVRDFVNMADAVNRARAAQAYDYATNGGHNGSENSQERIMRLPVDIWANDNAFTIKAFLPGINADDVEITFEGEELTIQGSFPANEADVEYVKRELYAGKFARTLTFNVPVNVDGIEATFAQGVLMLNVPKAEEILPKRIAVQAK